MTDLALTAENIPALARRAGGYAVAAALAASTHPRGQRIRNSDALVLLVAGFHADLALQSSDGYNGATVTELAALIPTLAPSTVRVCIGSLEKMGFVYSRSEVGGVIRYRLSADVVAEFDEAPAAPATAE